MSEYHFSFALFDRRMRGMQLAPKTLWKNRCLSTLYFMREITGSTGRECTQYQHLFSMATQFAGEMVYGLCVLGGWERSTQRTQPPSHRTRRLFSFRASVRLFIYCRP